MPRFRCAALLRACTFHRPVREAGAYALAQPECGNAGRDVRECLVLPRPPEVDPRVAMEMNFTEFPPEVGGITAVIFCAVPVAEQRAGWDADRESVT